jgi:hypothetical protein
MDQQACSLVETELLKWADHACNIRHAINLASFGGDIFKHEKMPKAIKRFLIARFLNFNVQRSY